MCRVVLINAKKILNDYSSEHSKIAFMCIEQKTVFNLNLTFSKTIVRRRKVGRINDTTLIKVIGMARVYSHTYVFNTIN